MCLFTDGVEYPAHVLELLALARPAFVGGNHVIRSFLACLYYFYVSRTAMHSLRQEYYVHAHTDTTSDIPPRTVLYLGHLYVTEFQMLERLAALAPSSGPGPAERNLNSNIWNPAYLNKNGQTGTYQYAPVRTGMHQYQQVQDLPNWYKQVQDRTRQYQIS